MPVQTLSTPEVSVRSTPARAFAAQSAESSLAPHEIRRRVPAADDVLMDILYCGVCHSDLHQVRNDWNEHGLSRPCRATRSSAA